MFGLRILYIDTIVVAVVLANLSTWDLQTETLIDTEILNKRIKNLNVHFRGMWTGVLE